MDNDFWQRVTTPTEDETASMTEICPTCGDWIRHDFEIAHKWLALIAPRIVAEAYREAARRLPASDELMRWRLRQWATEAEQRAEGHGG